MTTLLIYLLSIIIFIISLYGCIGILASTVFKNILKSVPEFPTEEEYSPTTFYYMLCWTVIALIVSVFISYVSHVGLIHIFCY